MSKARRLTGAVAGVGAEYAFFGNGSAKLEYDHVELDNWSLATNTVIAGDRLNVSRHIDMVKAGVNWRFGWANSGY